MGQIFILLTVATIHLSLAPLTKPSFRALCKSSRHQICWIHLSAVPLQGPICEAGAMLHGALPQGGQQPCCATSSHISWGKTPYCFLNQQMGTSVAGLDIAHAELCLSGQAAPQSSPARSKTWASTEPHHENHDFFNSKGYTTQSGESTSAWVQSALLHLLKPEGLIIYYEVFRMGAWTLCICSASPSAGWQSAWLWGASTRSCAITCLSVPKGRKGSTPTAERQPPCREAPWPRESIQIPAETHTFGSSSSESRGQRVALPNSNYCTCSSHLNRSQSGKDHSNCREA